jgi:epoxyqueuosine reductase
MIERVRAALAEEGLHIARPLNQQALDQAGISLSLAELLPGGLTGLVIGDGGGDFFARFEREVWNPLTVPDEKSRGDGGGLAAEDSSPLDDYTRRVMDAVLTRAEVGSFAILFPFSRQPLILPMQRLGEAAGLPRPGPLALQIHPDFGPWWAYRAFAVFPWAAPLGPALSSACEGCPAPCVAACPGRAVDIGGFDLPRCLTHRLAWSGCQYSCAARLACPVGASKRYSEGQLRFHMGASFRLLRAGPTAGPGSSHTA